MAWNDAMQYRISLIRPLSVLSLLGGWLSSSCSLVPWIRELASVIVVTSTSRALSAAYHVSSRPLPFVTQHNPRFPSYCTHQMQFWWWMWVLRIAVGHNFGPFDTIESLYLLARLLRQKCADRAGAHSNLPNLWFRKLCYRRVVGSWNCLNYDLWWQGVIKKIDIKFQLYDYCADDNL